jgi:hypothetical protein
MMIHWELEEKIGKEGRLVKKKYLLELYDPQHHQVGSEATIRAKPIIAVSEIFLSLLTKTNVHFSASRSSLRISVIIVSA